MRYYHYLAMIQIPLAIIPLVLITMLDQSTIKEHANFLAWFGLVGMFCGFTIPITIFILPNRNSEWEKRNVDN